MSSGGRQATSRWTLAALAGVLLAGACPAASARAVPAVTPEPFGVNGGIVWPENGTLPTAHHAAAMAASGVGSVRVVAMWATVEPQPPDPVSGAHRFDWRTTDDIARTLAAVGLRWDLVVAYSTAWAGVVPGSLAGPPRTGPYAYYAGVLAARYGARGDFWRAHPELPYLPVRAFELWNEPNLPGATGMEAARYADLYHGAREAILAVDARARVAVGGLAHSAESGQGSAVSYLEDMVAARPSLAQDMDALGITVYSGTPAGVLRQVAIAREALDRLGARRTPIDLDETGWPSRGAIPFTDVAPLDEAQRAENLTALVALATSADCGLARVTPYAWVTAEDNPVDGGAWLGLADRRSAALKPSGAAYAAAITAAQAATDRAPASTPDVCGRPDFPRLTARRGAPPAAFAVRLSRRCAARRLHLTFTRGTQPEPLHEVRVHLPGSAVARTARVALDGSAAGSAAALRLRLPRRAGVVTATGFDDLGRPVASSRARLKRCSR